MNRKEYIEKYRRELINQVNPDAHYFILMHPLETTGLPGLYATSSLTRAKWVECIVDEKHYKLEDGYKVELRSIEEGYGREAFYLEDFLDLKIKGYIVEKVPGIHCEEVEGREPIPGTNAYYNHSAYVLTRKQKK